jgi:Zn-dependent protease with chaperone function
MTTTNTIKTVLLLGLLSAMLLFAGEAIAGRQGLYMGLGFAVLMNFSGYFFSDKIALASYSAQPVTETENPEVYRRVAPIVQGLCQRMDLPMPRLWLLPKRVPTPSPPDAIPRTHRWRLRWAFCGSWTTAKSKEWWPTNWATCCTAIS